MAFYVLLRAMVVVNGCINDVIGLFKVINSYLI